MKKKKKKNEKKGLQYTYFNDRKMITNFFVREKMFIFV